MPINSNVFFAVSCNTFEIPGLILRSLIDFELIFVQGERHRSSFSFMLADIQFSQHQLLKRPFYPWYVFGTFVKNQVGIATWIHIWAFYSVPLVFISVFVPVP
jgi:hypothetical protein